MRITGTRSKQAGICQESGEDARWKELAETFLCGGDKKETRKHRQGKWKKTWKEKQRRLAQPGRALP